MVEPPSMGPRSVTGYDEETYMLSDGYRFMVYPAAILFWLNQMKL